MAHFAKIVKGIVTDIIVTSNDEPNEGADWIKANLPGTWVQTSFNTQGGKHSLGGSPLRKNYAGIGFTYDKTRDAFIPEKPNDSWVLNEDSCLWEAPHPRPDESEVYFWDNETSDWVRAG